MTISAKWQCMDYTASWDALYYKLHKPYLCMEYTVNCQWTSWNSFFLLYNNRVINDISIIRQGFDLKEVAAISPQCRGICSDHSCAGRACEAGDEMAAFITGGSVLTLHCTKIYQKGVFEEYFFPNKRPSVLGLSHVAAWHLTHVSNCNAKPTSGCGGGGGRTNSRCIFWGKGWEQA